MGRKLRTGLKVAGVTLLLGAGAIGYAVYDQLHPALPPNLSTYSGLRLTDAAGQPVLLGVAVVPHAATIVAFWASWCVPCRSEAAALARLRRQYRAGDLNIVYLNIDDLPNSAAASTFLRAARAETLPIIYAGHAGWATVTGQRTIALPRSYVFGRNGEAQAVFPGFDQRSGAEDLNVAVAAAVGGTA